jgi:hypothetical protein
MSAIHDCLAGKVLGSRNAKDATCTHIICGLLQSRQGTCNHLKSYMYVHVCRYKSATIAVFHMVIDLFLPLVIKTSRIDLNEPDLSCSSS